MTKAFITGCAGLRLTADERSFLADERPFGLILFARNVAEPAQVRDLVADYRDCVADPDAPVLIDQEGGRVRRLRPPHWPDYPVGAVYGRLYAAEPACGERAAWLVGRLIAADLADLGITVDCLPIADLRFPETDNVIGDRAYDATPEVVAAIGRAQANGLAAGGVLPVLKHVPGHGRATVDSHLELPVVEASADQLSAQDFEPFRRLADLPFAMTAHVVYTALDPDLCATLSPTIIDKVIRGDIRLTGCLMSDDVSMKALGGPIRDRVSGLLAAGCDLALHCNGDFAEMREVAAAAPALSGAAAARAQRAKASRRPAEPADRSALRAEFDSLLAAALV